MANFRRSPRYAFQLEVMVHGATSRPALTEDLSRHGVFIRTDEAPLANQLLRFAVRDPNGGEPIDLLGIVARVVYPSEAETDEFPGVGVSLFGNARAVDRRWAALVKQVGEWAAQGLNAPPTTVPGPVVEVSSVSDAECPVDAVHRAHVRRPARFTVTVRPKGLAELSHVRIRDISEGGTFVLSQTLLPLRTEVTLHLVHPTTGEAFDIPGLVVRAVDSLEPKEKGLGVRFTPNPTLHAGWDAFVKQNAPARSGHVPSPAGALLTNHLPDSLSMTPAPFDGPTPAPIDGPPPFAAPPTPTSTPFDGPPPFARPGTPPPEAIRAPQTCAPPLLPLPSAPPSRPRATPPPLPPSASERPRLPLPLPRLETPAMGALEPRGPSVTIIRTPVPLKSLQGAILGPNEAPIEIITAPILFDVP